MRKFWCIALAFGGPSEGLTAISMQVADLQEMAVAKAVSDVYLNTGSQLPLMGVNCRELTRDYLVEVLKAIDELEQKPAVVQLVRHPGAGEVFNGQLGAVAEKQLDDEVQRRAREEMLIFKAPLPDEPA